MSDEVPGMKIIEQGFVHERELAATRDNEPCLLQQVNSGGKAVEHRQGRGELLPLAHRTRNSSEGIVDTPSRLMLVANFPVAQFQQFIVQLRNMLDVAQFDWPVIAGQMLEVYEAALAGTAPP